MGSVWQGVHATLGTRVAIKFIDAEHANSVEARSRFENEARAAAALRSKYVVEVYDHGVTADGRPFIVMEYLEGEPLDRRLERVGRLPAKQVALILQQVCRALAKAHAARIVHRDLKPENIFLVWDDEDGTDVAKVVDFGIAKFTDGSLGPSSATRTGSVLGTPYYMSPEQARGLRSVDQRTDIWSLGVIAYRAIVGELPFDGEAIGDLLVKLCTGPIPVPSRVAPDVPPGFDAFIQRSLARDPQQRFQSVQEFSASLCAVAGVSLRGLPFSAEMPEFSGALGTGPHAAQAVTEPRPIAPETIADFPEAAATGAPLSQTTPALGSRRSGALLYSAGAALVVLGAGLFALSRVLGGAPSAPSVDAAATFAEGTATPATAPAASVAAPTPLVTQSARPLDAPPQPSSSTTPPRAESLPSAASRATAASAGAAARPAAAPALKPPARPASPPAQRPNSASSHKEIDIGY